MTQERFKEIKQSHDSAWKGAVNHSCIHCEFFEEIERLQNENNHLRKLVEIANEMKEAIQEEDKYK